MVNKFLNKNRIYPMVIKLTLLSFLSSLLLSLEAYALPINFGITQGDMEYEELTSPNFKVYFDSRVPEEGAMALHSLEAAKPLVEKWMGKEREAGDPLKVVMSNVTSNASFANFIMDAIELQTPYQNIRDLAWHEYAHSSMYLHYHNLFGPPGTILHIMWMPAWFLEGLAEAFSVSVGSEYQSGVERWQSLSGNWPSYDRMHSLYQNPKWSGRGYATSGAFVSWVLRRMYQKPDAEFKTLGELLEDFRSETMPWSWFTNYFLPMEDTLEKSTGFGARELYEQYKKEANAYWQVASPYPFLASDKRFRLKIRGGRSFHTKGKFTLFFQKEDGYYRRYRAVFDKKSGWMIGAKKTGSLLPKDAIESTYLKSLDLRAYVKEEPPVGNAYRDSLLISLEQRMGGGVDPDTPIDKQTDLFSSNMILKFEKDAKFQKVYVGGQITDLFETSMRLGWFETTEKEKKLCSISKRNLRKFYQSKKPITPECQLVSKGSFDVELIGSKTSWDKAIKTFVTDEIWFRLTDHSTTGDRHRLITWTSKTRKLSKKSSWPLEARPVNAIFSGKDTWVLAADRSRTHLWKIDENAGCIETLPLSDFVLGGYGVSDGSIILRIYEGFENSIRKIKPKNFKKGICYTPVAHTSPLMEGMRHIYASKPELLKPKSTDKKQDTSEAAATPEASSAPPSDIIPSLKEILESTAPWDNKYLKEAQARKREREEKKLDPNKTIEQTSQQTASDDSKTEKKLASLEARNTAFKKSPNMKNEAPWTDAKKQTASDAKIAETRWSSPLYFPWIGGEDYKGTQLGIISIPLIDDLQNNTVRATFLYGVASGFPHIDVTYSNRSYNWPLDASIYKKQTYNGALTLSNGTTYVNYWNEIGTLIRTSKAKRLAGILTRLDAGLKIANLEEEYGLTFNNKGLLNEPFVNLSFSKGFAGRYSLGLSIGVKYAGEAINENFDYTKIATSLNLSRSMFSSSNLSIGVEYAQTRGEKMMLLREYYTPLKTHIPGSGGGLNQSNFQLIGEGNLFGVFIGDTKMRTKLNFTAPIIDDLDQIVWILYAERLDFSAFINYGGIWDDGAGSTFDDASFIGAHGYNIDLQLENKGVRFNVGVGIGQLFNKEFTTSDFEVYGKAGFDAFF